MCLTQPRGRVHAQFQKMKKVKLLGCEPQQQQQQRHYQQYQQKESQPKQQRQRPEKQRSSLLNGFSAALLVSIIASIYINGINGQGECNLMLYLHRKANYHFL